MSVNEKMTALADAIRDKTGGTDLLTLDDMAAGVDEVYAAGKKSEWDAFWDSFQENGKRTNYMYGFDGYGWTDATFRPKYDIVPTSINYLFANTQITDLQQLLENAGACIDTSKATSITYVAINNNWLTTLPTLDFSSCNDLTYCLYGNAALRIVEKVILKNDGSQKFSTYTFFNNANLQEIRFEGVIGGSGIDFSASKKLSKESIASIINCLSSTTSGKTITLSKAAKEAAFTADEWAAVIATKSNWTISLA